MYGILACCRVKNNRKRFNFRGKSERDKGICRPELGLYNQCATCTEIDYPNWRYVWTVSQWIGIATAVTY